MTEERIRELLQQAIDRSEGDYLMEDIEQFLVEGKMQLWTTASSAAVTEVICYPRNKVVLVLLAAGDLQEICDTVPQVEAFAKAVGASRISMCGRRGWVKPLAELGFKEAHTGVSREVT